MTRYLSVWIAGRRTPDAPGRAPLTPASLADWCRRFTPLSAPDAPDGAMLDITGASHLFGGETALAARIERAFASHGRPARCAVASSPEGAWALARFGKVQEAPEGADEKTLRRLFGPLPVAALRLDPSIVSALLQTGLKRIDDLLPRPRAPLAARFGEHLFARLDAVMNRAKNPISPRFDAPVYLVERRFAEPIARREDIEGIIAALSGDLARLLERHGEGARRLDLSLFRVDGHVRRIAVGTSRPLRDPQVFVRLFRERIAAREEAGEDAFDADYGFDLMQLAALSVETFAPRQQEFPVAARPDAPFFQTAQLFPLVEPAATGRACGPPPDEDVAVLVDRLGARLGLQRVVRFVPNDTHIPEAAMLAVPAASTRVAETRGKGGRKTGTIAREDALPRNDAPHRPLRLFERPELIETVAEVPDGPPLRFRWRRLMHEVAAIEGPERIAPEWWRHEAAALTRDYFRVEDKTGHRFWLFREGLYGRETARPRWFLHGLFA